MAFISVFDVLGPNMIGPSTMRVNSLKDTSWDTASCRNPLN